MPPFARWNHGWTRNTFFVFILFYFIFPVLASLSERKIQDWPREASNLGAQMRNFPPQYQFLSECLFWLRILITSVQVAFFLPPFGLVWKRQNFWVREQTVGLSRHPHFPHCWEPRITWGQKIPNLHSVWRSAGLLAADSQIHADGQCPTSPTSMADLCSWTMPNLTNSHGRFMQLDNAQPHQLPRQIYAAGQCPTSPTATALPTFTTVPTHAKNQEKAGQSHINTLFWCTGIYLQDA